MTTMLEAIQSALHPLHARFRTVSTRHLPELTQEIAELSQYGMPQSVFSNETHGIYRLAHCDAPPTATAVIIIAIPQGITILDFHWNNTTIHAAIPPTYPWQQVPSTCQQALSQHLPGRLVTPAFVPFKLLAVRSGLGQYGRTNLCYLNGMGSFHRLEAFYTDAPALPDHWQKKQPMPQCDTCSRCLDACPLHAIVRERFLIHADRCLTYYNEDEKNLPAWIPPDVHNSLIGCLRCQMACPQNAPHLNTREPGASFSKDETRLILQATPWEALPADLKSKLCRYNIDGYYTVLPRNLSYLLKTTQTGSLF